jgi:hypothetical protein
MDAWSRAIANCMPESLFEGEMTDAQLEALECLSSIRDGVRTLDDFPDATVQRWMDVLGGPQMIPLFLGDWEEFPIDRSLEEQQPGRADLPDVKLFDSSPGDYILQVSAARMPEAKEVLEQIRREAGLHFLPQAAGAGDAFAEPDEPTRLYASCFFPDEGTVSWRWTTGRTTRPLRLVHLTHGQPTLVTQGILRVEQDEIRLDVTELPEQFQVVWCVFDDIKGQPDIQRGDHGALFVIRRLSYVEANQLREEGEIPWWRLAWEGCLHRAWKKIGGQCTANEAQQNLHFVFSKMCSLLRQAAAQFEKLEPEKLVVPAASETTQMSGIAPKLGQFEISKTAIVRRLRSIPKQEVASIQLALIEAFRPTKKKRGRQKRA